MYLSPHKGLCLMEIQCAKDTEPQLPPFVTVQRDVTREKAYSMHVLSRLDSTVEI